MQFDVKGAKQPYSAPQVTRLTFCQAKQIVAERLKCSGQEAINVLEALQREQQERGGSHKSPLRMSGDA